MPNDGRLRPIVPLPKGFRKFVIPVTPSNRPQPKPVAKVPAFEPLLKRVMDVAEVPSRSTTLKRQQDGAAEHEEPVKKRSQAKWPEDLLEIGMDMELSINHTMALLNRLATAKHIAQRTREFNPELAFPQPDIGEIIAPGIRNTDSWEKPRATEDLPAFIECFSRPRRTVYPGPPMTYGPAANGTPHTLVIAAAALRAADLKRVLLEQFEGDEGVVAKLFAKHIRVRQAVRFLENTRITMGVGTPQRILTLIENGSLKTDRLERVIVDSSHIDEKKRGILDMKQTHMPLVQLLGRGELAGRYPLEGPDRIELLFF